jgi:hypothetical protein
MAGEVTVTGLAEVQRLLDEAPGLIVGRAFQKASEAACLVIEETLYFMTPEREEGERSEDQVHLRDAIMREIEMDSRFRGVVADIGFGREGYRAMWVEYGHRMVGHKPGKKPLGIVPPHPFIRRAFEASADKAIAVFQDVLVTELAAIYG